MTDRGVSNVYEGTVYSNRGNAALLALVPPTARLVMDVGCGAGDNAKALSSAGHEVWGITASAQEAALAQRYCREVVVGDVEEPLPANLPRTFDLILCSHVLEHLRYPRETLVKLAHYLKEGGLVAIAVPNMANWRIRARLLRGDWSREEQGPFDRTHLHFWSYQTLTDLVAGGPFEILRHTGDFSLPQWPLRRIAPRWSSKIDSVLGSRIPNFAAGQTLLLVSKRNR